MDIGEMRSRLEDTRQQVKIQLDEIAQGNILSDTERLKIIKNQVEGLWKGKKFQGYYTLHDPSHNKGVEDALYKLIPISDKVIPLCGSAGKKPLSKSQWFCLLAAAWLHDVGMLPNVLNNDPIKGYKLKDIYQAREVHHERSRNYVYENSNIFHLNENEKKNIGTICYYHRRSINLEECSPEDNLPLLSAYLRLADGIHINSQRVDDDLFELFQLIGMPDDSKFHWIKSKLTEEIIPDPHNLSINICFKFKRTDLQDSDIVINMIADEIKSELYTVRDILIKGGISYYLSVDIEENESPGDENVKVLLKQMIDSVRLDTWASASDVADCLVDSIKYLNSLEDKEKSIELLIKFRDSVVQKNLKTRTCHVIIEKIFNIINKNLGLRDQIPPEEILSNIEKELTKIKKDREEAADKIAENAKMVLNGNESILLFGHSKIVLKALSKVEDKEKTPIYICEGRNSGRYSYTNELVYCDGLEYARSVKGLGFKIVKLIPDILVGNLLARKEDGIQKIVLGANGIDIESASFGHTAGHLSIAALAKTYKIPVYVLADSFKFGNLNYNNKIERDTQWLMGKGSQCYPQLKGIELFNPREDKVDSEYVYLLITERGGFPPERIPKILKSQYEKYEKDFGNKQEEGSIAPDQITFIHYKKA